MGQDFVKVLFNKTDLRLKSLREGEGEFCSPQKRPCRRAGRAEELVREKERGVHLGRNRTRTQNPHCGSPAKSPTLRTAPHS